MLQRALVMGRKHCRYRKGMGRVEYLFSSYSGVFVSGRQTRWCLRGVYGCLDRTLFSYVFLPFDTYSPF